MTALRHGPKRASGRPVGREQARPTVGAVARTLQEPIDTGEAISVGEESRNRLVALGVPIDRIDIVRNTSGLHRLSQIPSPEIKRKGAPVEIVYLGVMEVARGVGLLVEAASRLKAIYH